MSTSEVNGQPTPGQQKSTMAQSVSHPTGPQAAPASSQDTPHSRSVPLVPPPPTAEQIAEIEKRRARDIRQLDSLGGQILSLLGKMTTEHAMGLAADLQLLKDGQQPYSPAPEEYRRLRDAFADVHKMFIPPPSLIPIAPLNLPDQEQIQGLRKANEAIWCSAIFAGGLGQQYLDQSFLEVFVPPNGSLSKMQANIWLELKTRSFMTAMSLKVAPVERVMLELFPSGMANRILARRPGTTVLFPSEQEFLVNLEARKKSLQDHVDRKALTDLDDRFPYIDFAKVVTKYLIENHVKPRDSSYTQPKATAEIVAQFDKIKADPEYQNAPSIVGIAEDEFDDLLDDAFDDALIGTGVDVRPTSKHSPMSVDTPGDNPSSQNVQVKNEADGRSPTIGPA